MMSDNTVFRHQYHRRQRCLLFLLVLLGRGEVQRQQQKSTTIMLANAQELTVEEEGGGKESNSISDNSITNNTMETMMPSSGVTNAKTEEEENVDETAVVHYVMEPFDQIDDDWFVIQADTDDILLSLVDTENEENQEQNVKFGHSALRIEWNSNSGEVDDSTNMMEFGWILQDTKPHNVYGATHISLWYKVLEASSLLSPATETTQQPFQLQLYLYDDTECVINYGYQSNLCSQSENLLLYEVAPTQPHIVEDAEDITEDSSSAINSSWKQILIPIDNDSLDPLIKLQRVRGWKIRLTTNSDHQITLVVDHFSFIGGGDLFGSAFYILDGSMDFSERYPPGEAKNLADFYANYNGVSNRLWQHTYYESDISTNETSAILSNQGVLDVNYTIEQVEAWGGFVEFGFMAPGNAHYDLEDATHISIDFKVPKEASIPGRSIFRFLLEDISDCIGGEECYNNNLSHERYYSFHSILDTPTTQNDAVKQLSIPLVGSRDPSTPFWLTGWAGITGNGQFDPHYLKGYYFELVLDSQLEMGDLVRGRVQFSNLQAAKKEQQEGLTAPGAAPKGAECHAEYGVQLLMNMPTFERVEFLGQICCELCMDDPNCLYGVATGRDCFMAQEIDPEYVSLGTPRDIYVQNFELIQALQEEDALTFWMDDPIKRGEYCTLCDCQPKMALLDCSGKDLKILPKTFTPDVHFVPKILDLRGNPRLAILGSDMLLPIFAESLEKLYLSSSMKHISNDLFDLFPLISIVSFEPASLDDEENGDDELISSVTPNNVIQGSADFFSNICCSRGTRINGLASPAEGLEFCDLVQESPGIDSIYEDFKAYDLDIDVIRIISPRSNFMSEAAESAEKCAEFCTISETCRYFQYDARLPNADHACTLLRNVTGPAYSVCCERDDYADLNRTLPGWVAGIPPRTRHDKFDASVLISSDSLTVDKDTRFAAQYDVSLGANPLRGAVWIEPKVVTSSFEVEIKPRRLVLYDRNSTATVNIVIQNVDKIDRSTLVIENIVESCDIAFKQSSGSLIYVEVLREEEVQRISVGAIVGIVLVLVLLIVLLMWYLNKQNAKKNDSLWKVRREELTFDDPPEVLGRGTFGLVLLAEYRGTKVAVKRAVPPLNKKMREKSAHFSFVDKNDGDDAETSVGIGSVSLSYNQDAGSSKMSKNNWSKLKEDFISEMRILSKLRHPCITTVMGGVLSKDIEPALVMEYMEHRSLYQLLHNETFVFDGELTINILRDISQGIRFLHAANPQVIHGDLKSANILVDRKFRAKVADFGLSQKQSLGRTGTPYWMAPELLRKEANNTSASDIYSFGIILYEVYARKDPYKDENPKEVLQQIIESSICKRPPIPDGSPAEIQSLMESCLLDDAETRPTAEEIDNRLRRSGTKQLAPVDSRKGNKRMSLFDMFPSHIAKALEEGRDVEPEHREEVTIFFSDIVGFTTLSSTLTPRKVANMLDRLYHKFDALSQKHDLYKVETIGDAYLAVTNLVKDQPNDHAKLIADFAIDAVKASNETLVDEDDESKGFVNIRVGFHSGPIVADVVGNRNRKYTLFGDTINTSSRMESTSKTNRIQCSKASALLLRKQAPDIALASRGLIPVKGKGEMHTFWVNEEMKDGRNIDEVLASVQRHTAFDDIEMLLFAGKVQEELVEQAISQPVPKNERRRSSFILPTRMDASASNRRVSFHSRVTSDQISRLEEVIAV